LKRSRHHMPKMANDAMLAANDRALPR
jgi:hypothetical protein